MPIKHLAFAALLLLGLSSPALATQNWFFAGSEDTSWTVTGAIQTTTPCGSNCDSTYSRMAVGVSGTTLDPPTNFLATPAFSNQSTLWVHVSAFSGSISTTSGDQWLTFYGSDGVRRLMIRGTGTNSTLKISTRNTAGTITDLVTCTNAWPLNTDLAKIDVMVHYAVAGEMHIYRNGVSFCDFTGDVTTNSVTALNQVDFASFLLGSPQPKISQVAISDTDTRGWVVATIVPNGVGASSSWNGTCAAQLPGIPTINDAIFASTTASAQTQDCALANSVPGSGPYLVGAFVLEGRVLTAAGGPSQFDFVTRVGSTDYLSSARSPTSSFANYANYLQQTNPATSAGWAQSDIFNGTNFQFGIKSLP